MLKRLAGKLTFFRIAAGLVVLALLLTGIGLYGRENPADKPYLVVAGGGFIFNFRVAEAFYGFTVKVQKPLAVGSIIQAQFEDPAGGPPFVEETRVNARTTRYSLRSPGVHGVKKGQPYEVVISLYDYTGEELMERQTRQFKSSLDSKFVPEKPLTIGPGYAPNPELAPSY
jgi:hypothetical protein